MDDQSIKDTGGINTNNLSPCKQWPQKIDLSNLQELCHSKSYTSYHIKSLHILLITHTGRTQLQLFSLLTIKFQKIIIFLQIRVTKKCKNKIYFHSYSLKRAAKSKIQIFHVSSFFLQHYNKTYSTNMRFEQLFNSLIIPEWKVCYINYQLLKALVNLIGKAFYISQREKLKLSFQDFSRINQIIQTCNKLFFKAYQEQIFITFAFVQYKLIQLSDKKQEFFQLHSAVQVGNELYLSSIENLYVQINYLSDLIKLNLEGQRKILKKHFKTTQKLQLPTPSKRETDLGKMDQMVNKLKDTSEDLYISKSPLQSKQSRLSIRQLLLEEHSSIFASVSFGVGVGIAASIIGVIIGLLSYSNIYIDDDPLFVRDFHVFRGNLLLLIYLWLFSISVYIFEKFHINYKLVFNMNTHQTSSHMFARNSIVTAVFLILLLTWVVQRVKDQMHFMIYFGGISWLVTFTYFIIPVSPTNWRGRFYMLKLIGRSIISPITGVDFPIAWFTDQMVCLITCFTDFAYALCYYTTLDLYTIPTSLDKNVCNSSANVYVVFLVGMFIFVWRMLQCIRQGIADGSYFCRTYFFNTLKYLSALITLILSFVYSAANPNIFPLWCVFSVITTLYCYYWDLKYDWGLLEKGSRHTILRNGLAFKSPIVYYVILVVNFILRLSWILTLSPSIMESFAVKPIVFALITGTLEIIRGVLWNLIRVERQHMANCEQLLAIKYENTIAEIEPKFQSSTKLGLNENNSDREIRQQRISKLKDYVHTLVQKKQIQNQALYDFLQNSNQELKEIRKRCRV